MMLCKAESKIHLVSLHDALHLGCSNISQHSGLGREGNEGHSLTHLDISENASSQWGGLVRRGGK
jgi:hypothetical protein